MKNQVIRIIFDDNITKRQAEILAKLIVIEKFGEIAAIEVYEEEFTNGDNKDEQMQKEKPK